MDDLPIKLMLLSSKIIADIDGLIRFLLKVNHVLPPLAQSCPPALLGGLVASFLKITSICTMCCVSKHKLTQKLVAATLVKGCKH